MSSFVELSWDPGVFLHSTSNICNAMLTLDILYLLTTRHTFVLFADIFPRSIPGFGTR